MPPRHTYWTIILEGKPTAFRAHTQEELLPTLRQLQARHPDAVLRWFARGRLWQSQEEERVALAARRSAERERRGRDWRPGGSHRDPRERFNVPRDEKRRRFRDRLYRDRSGPAPERSGPREDRREPREDKHTRKPMRPREGRFRSGESKTRPSSSGRPGWKPNRPAGRAHDGHDRPGGDRDDRGWKPKGPKSQAGAGRGGTRGWSSDRRRNGPPAGRWGGRKPGGGGKKSGGGGGSPR
jgi:hypothetical protein